MTSPSPRSTGRWTRGSTGSTPPPPTALAARSRSSAGRCTGLSRAALCVHQELAAGRRHPARAARAQARLDPARGGSKPAAARRRCDRPVPDPLADPRAGHRGGLGGHGRAEGARPGPAYRRVQLHSAAATPHRLDRAGRDHPAAVLADRPGRRGGDPAARTAGRHRRDRLLPDGLRPADRGDHPGADRGDARRRLAQERPAVHRAAAQPDLALAARLQAVAARHGTTPGAVAIAWTLRNPAVDGAIAGFRRPRWTRSSPRRASSSPART